MRRTQKDCEITTSDLSYVVTVKSMLEISQNFVKIRIYELYLKNTVGVTDSLPIGKVSKPEGPLSPWAFAKCTTPTTLSTAEGQNFCLAVVRQCDGRKLNGLDF